MTWIIEKWFEEVFPGKQNIFREYQNLPSRELMITCAAVIDVALAELISLRLRDDKKETTEFLGANGDGRAPLGSLGSKIQMAYLLNIISKSDAEILKAIKNMRNIFAHRVKVDFKNKLVVKHLKKLALLWRNLSFNFFDGKFKDQSKIDELIKKLGTEDEIGEGLLLAIFAVYQAYFHRLREIIVRVDNFKNNFTQQRV